jgi:hypothetical protein
MRAFAIVCWMLCLPALAGDWRDTLTPLQPGKFPLLRPLKATYKFGWSALTAADADFDFTRLKGGRLKLVVNAKTTGFVRSLWRMDAKHESLCDAATLRPICLQQTETYKAKTLIAKDNFSQQKVERWLESKPAADSPAKWRNFKCENVFDLQSALLFARSQPMKTGDVYRLIVYPAKEAYLAEIDVVGREPLTVAGKEYDGIKCELRLQGVTKDLQLEPHKKFKRACIWVSDDRDRLLLKIQAEVFVGSVWAELDSLKFSDP